MEKRALHLDTRSWFSFHDGVNSPRQLVAAAAELGFSALGLCDVDGVYGLLEFHRAAVQAGIRPVLGLALTDPAARKPNPRHDGPPPDTSRSAATIIARDRDGYHALCQLASWRQGAHPQPEASRWKLPEALMRLCNRCFVITDREDLIRALAPLLGPRYLFVRLDPDYGKPGTGRQHRQSRLASRWRLHPAACTDVRFIRPQDQPVHHLLHAIGQNTHVQWASGVRPPQHYLAGPFELPNYYERHPGALEATAEIAACCDVDFPSGEWGFPDYETPAGKVLPRAQAARALGELCRHYAPRRVGDDWDQRYTERLEHELAVIHRLGYTSYFLACWDLVHESWRRGITTLGRGSAGNSLASYLLGITPVDPLKLKLPFERFINPERSSPPDIDIDFDWRRRDEMIDYLFARWGRLRVARISTHNSFRGRGAWSATAKACGIPQAEARRISKRLPWVNPSGLRQLDSYPELSRTDLSDDWTQAALSLASRLSTIEQGRERGIPTHLGVHCGGIVIAPGDITHYTALQASPCGHPVTQFEMHSTEDAGLIKIDLLGNRSLGVLVDTATGAGTVPPGDYARIDQDGHVQGLLRDGRTMGCFYMESPAMRQLLKRLRTESFTALTAASSVIRPGVAESGMMQEYIRRERGMPRKQDSHPLLEQIMPETHGVMVYQEDVLRVAHELAGFSYAEADVLRRGMSGKLRSREQINQLRERFVSGCRDNGLAVRDALEVWRQVESFSGYAFCKAHSASFATLSMQVAWLKAHYPAQFMAAVLDNGGGFYGPQPYLSECRRLGLALRPPDINHSGMSFSAPDARTVQCGLGLIKRVPGNLKQRIINLREHSGPYSSLQEFIRRVRPGPQWLEVLIDCGALDSLGIPRPELFHLAGEEYRHALAAGENGSGQLFADARRAGGAWAQAADREQPGLAALCARELLHLGCVVRAHPLDAFTRPDPSAIPARELAHHAGKQATLQGWFVAAKRVSIRGKQQAGDWLRLAGEELDAPEEYYDIEDSDHQSAAEDLGIISGAGRTQYHNRHGQAMLMLSLEDQTDTFEAVLFPAAYARFAHLLHGHGPWLVSGTVEEQYGACTLNVQEMTALPLPEAARIHATADGERV